jgi:hypothetical protein
LWLVPPLVLILPPLIWGWLTYRVMAYRRAGPEHASAPEERIEIFRKDNRGCLLGHGRAERLPGRRPQPGLGLGGDVCGRPGAAAGADRGLDLHAGVRVLPRCGSRISALAALQALRAEAVPAGPATLVVTEIETPAVALPHAKP